MPDKRTDRLLFAVNTLCRGAFRVVEEEELLSCFSSGDGVDGESLKGMLGYLADRGYIDVQYAEEGVYCVRPLPEGRLYFEREKEARAKGRKNARTLAITAAVSAFFGAFFGSGLALLFSLFT
ncbi:MAG: hypothetical protein ACI4ST_03090 [Candidatus Gallimonas sp.]